MLVLSLFLVGCSNQPTNVTAEGEKPIITNGQISSEDCRLAGGEVLWDPGDGSIYEKDLCGPDREQLGIPEGYEGGICCLKNNQN